MAHHSVLAAAAVWVAVSVTGCSREGEPQPQLVVVIDSDAPVIGQLAGDATLSADAAIDTVRIDAIAADGTVYDKRELVAPEALDWPLSLGVASRSPPSSVRLRIRAFRGLWAAPDSIGGLLEPLREVTIDRLIELPLPDEGVSTVRVHLSLACMGHSVSFIEPATTCVDALALESPPSAGVEALDEVPAETRVGTSPIARELPCTGSPPGDDALCIPGGFTVLGDRSLVGVADVIVYDPYPLRPVRVSPFWLERTEITVGRFRALFASGAAVAEPTLQDPADPLTAECSWRGVDDASHDTLALTCVTGDDAATVCELLGGRFPSEAEWEHAARGRGQQRRYPWGDGIECCTASAGRAIGPCSTNGAEPVASHLPSESCAGMGDVSRDGVVDMGGGVIEYVRDDFARYGEGCWSWRGIAFDPVCVDAAGGRAARGGDWGSPLAQTAAVLRKLGVHGPTQGLRCAYPDGGG